MQKSIENCYAMGFLHFCFMFLRSQQQVLRPILNNYENKQQFGTKPKEIDILVIKKQKNVPIKKNIGRIFRKHNIIEYKSPTDYVSIDDFYKGCAYALFYKSDTAVQNEILIEDITLTFVCVKYPKRLMEHLKEALKYNITKSDNGIYYISKTDNILPIQVIVTSMLSSDENLWLKSLTNQLTNEDDAKRLITEYEINNDNKLYESVIDIILRANKNNLKKEDYDMSVVLDTWFDSVIKKHEEEAAKAALHQGINQGIEAFIIDALEDGKSEDIIISKLMKRFHFSEAEAKEYFDKYALVSE